MIELLVVMLILGILAAIAIPTFLTQQAKANEAVAKALARTAQTAAVTYGTDNNGSFVNLSAGALRSLESSLNDTSGASLSSATGTSNTFTVVVTAKAPDTNTFTVVRNSDGSVTRRCATAGTNGCLSGGSW